MNQQRRSVYRLRRMVLGFGAGVPVVEYDEDPKTKKKTRREQVFTWADQREHVLDLVEDLVIDMVGASCPNRVSDWNLDGLTATVKEQFGVEMRFAPPAGQGRRGAREIEEQVYAWSRSSTAQKEEELGDDADGVPVLRRYEQWLYLRPSTSSGRTTCSRWTTCARASACAATARRTRSRSTRRKATRCSCR